MVPAQNRTASLLLIALWFGVFSGLLEGISYLSFQSLGWIAWHEQIRPVDENILWASPLMNGLLFLCLGILMLVPARLFARWQWTTIAVWMFATLSAYGFFSVSGRFRERGVAALAIGLGTVAGRWVAKPGAGRFAIFRKTLVPLLVTAIMLGVGGYGWAGLRERILVSRLPSPPAGAPNVLLIVLDTLRSDRLGAYGYSRPTSPFLDRYARESVQFDAAFSTSSWTFPAHASIFTGKLSHEHGAVLFPINLRVPTLAESLAGHGYATAGFVANVMPMSKAFGLSKGFQRWENLFFGAYDSAIRTLFGRKTAKYLMGGIRTRPEMTHMRAPEIRRRFLHWVDSRPGRPFFAFLNFMEMHEYSPPYEYATRFSTQPERITPPGNPLFFRRPGFSDQARSDAYDASLAFLDAELEALFEELSKRGLDKNLVVIITSDHGASLGEHDLFGHRTSLYRDQIQVPLWIRFDGRTPRGAHVGSTVGLERLPATVLDLAGIPNQAFPRSSLVPFWLQAELPMDQVALSELTGDDWLGLPPNAPIRQGWLKALVKDNWHFILKKNGEQELFDWRADAREEHNLARDPRQKDQIAEMRARLKQLAHLAP